MIFALETLYMWPFSDAENEHLYSVCEAKTSLGATGFDDLKTAQIKNKHFLDSVRKYMNSHGLRDKEVLGKPMIFNDFQTSTLFKKWPLQKVPLAFHLNEP